MNGMIDYIASMITGAMVFLMMLNHYFSISATAITELFNSTTQEDITSITEIIEHDVRKAGYRITDSVAFALIDSTKLAVRGDFNNDGTPDTARYWLAAPLSNPTTAAKTLYRKVGDKTVTLTTNLIERFNVRYLNKDGLPTVNTKEVQSVDITLSILSKLSYEGEHAGAYWQRTIKPQNVR